VIEQLALHALRPLVTVRSIPHGSSTGSASGRDRNPQAGRTAAARERFFEMVEEVACRDRIPFHAAMKRARGERSDLFRAAFPKD
jgi:hypothetical protein